MGKYICTERKRKGGKWVKRDLREDKLVVCFMRFKESEAFFLDFTIDLFVCLLLFVNYGNSTCYYRFFFSRHFFCRR